MKKMKASFTALDVDKNGVINEDDVADVYNNLAFVYMWTCNYITAYTCLDHFNNTYMDNKTQLALGTDHKTGKNMSLEL